MNHASGKSPAARHQPEVEDGTAFLPSFDSQGLIPAIATDADTGEVVMFAWMDRKALERTLASGYAHYYSRSRGRLWQKGEESGNFQRVAEILTDCDQDVLWLKVRTAGPGLNCHTRRRSCFYRAVERDPSGGSRLVFRD